MDGVASFVFTYFVVAVIYAVVRLLAVCKRVSAFKSVSPGMLQPLGIVFGLFVGFTAAQVSPRFHTQLSIGALIATGTVWHKKAALRGTD